MTGLKRGSVKLLSHQEEWNKNAENVILELKQLFGNAAVDIQHVGSTAIASIYAKPIIDIVIGLRNLNDISPYRKRLEEHGFIFRGEDVAGQMLFVMSDFELALQFPDNRRNYTESKQECIECLLKEAYVWRQLQDT